MTKTCKRRQVHSLLFASSGALLLCCVDRSRQLADLRQRMRATFPGAFSRALGTLVLSTHLVSVHGLPLGCLSDVLRGVPVRDRSQKRSLLPVGKAVLRSLSFSR